MKNLPDVQRLAYNYSDHASKENEVQLITHTQFVWKEWTIIWGKLMTSGTKVYQIPKCQLSSHPMNDQSALTEIVLCWYSTTYGVSCKAHVDFDLGLPYEGAYNSWWSTLQIEIESGSDHRDVRNSPTNDINTTFNDTMPKGDDLFLSISQSCETSNSTLIQCLRVQEI